MKMKDVQASHFWCVLSKFNGPFGRMPPTEVYLPMFVISVLTFVVGAWFFGRLKPAFSDHV